MASERPAIIRRQQGSWALYWPGPLYAMCEGEGCPDCPDWETPCRAYEIAGVVVSRHRTKGGAARFARQQGMGVLMVEE